MADTKISALTAASTPLAGTEVLPIVQSSTTKKVAVSDLTAGRSVSAASLSLTTTPLAVTSGGTGLATVAQGDLLYGSAANTLSALAKNTTATRYLANTGTSNNPAWAQIDLSNGVTGTLPVGNGGTGQSSYAVGDILYASASTTLSKLAGVATGNALISGGVTTAPSWGKIGLTTHVSGTLPTANGGTNLTSFTDKGVFYASSTSVMTNGTSLAFDGTNFSIGTNSASAKLHTSQTSAARAAIIVGNGQAQGLNAQIATICRYYAVVSLGTKLIIPFVNQGNLNLGTVCRVIGLTGEYNTNVPYGFTVNFAVGHVTSLSSLASWGTGGNFASIATNGMNVEITFTTAYVGGIFVTIEYMTGILAYSIDVANIAMN